MVPRRPSARTRILAVADRLFYERGVQAVGVETIVAEADAAKTTLYSHFGSKDGLVVAYLEGRAARARERLERELGVHGGTEQLLGVYDLLAAEIAEPGYRGSAFLNASVELGCAHPAAAVTRDHRAWLLDLFGRLAAGAPAPDALAAQLLQLYEAATVAAQIAGDGDPGPARAARAAAAALLGARPAAPSPAPAPATARRVAESPEAHRLLDFLNTAHLPDGDDRFADERAGPWLASWLTGAGAAVPQGLAAITAAPAPLRRLREGLRQLAIVNCGGDPDPRLVAEAAGVLSDVPLLLDLAGGAEPRLTSAGGPYDPGDRPGDPGADVTRCAVAVVGQAYLAVRAGGEWARVKVCAAPDCRWAFLDTTRNRSRRWCDMAGCGNRAKGRSWRERQAVVTTELA